MHNKKIACGYGAMVGKCSLYSVSCGFSSSRFFETKVYLAHSSKDEYRGNSVVKNLGKCLTGFGSYTLSLIDLEDQEIINLKHSSPFKNLNGLYQSYFGRFRN